MKTLLLQDSRMNVQPVLDALASVSFDVLLISSARELADVNDLSSFALIFLGLPPEEIIRAVDELRHARSETNSMIIGLVDDSHPDNHLLDDPTVLEKLDDCLNISESRDNLERRLAFLSTRASIREKNENTASNSSRELQRINSELTDSIKEQLEVQSALRESEALIRAILDTTVDGIITIDKEGRIETFNGAAEKIFGYSVEEIKGKNVSLLMPENHARHHDEYISTYIESRVAKIIGIGREVPGKRKDGSIFPLELSISELKIGTRTVFTGVVRDITERRRLEREILRAGDQERQRIGYDLHDGLGQALTGIGLISQNLANRVRPDDPDRAGEIDEVTRMVRDADQLARVIARQLVPVEVESSGLAYALKMLAENAEKLFDIKCTFEDPSGALIRDNSVATHLYRIAQEALSNAVRHGRASEVDIALESEPANLTLVIADNGSGLPARPDLKPSGMGLRIMQYRSRIISAVFSITGNESGGATVRCRVPINILTSSRAINHD